MPSSGVPAPQSDVPCGDSTGAVFGHIVICAEYVLGDSDSHVSRGASWWKSDQAFPVTLSTELLPGGLDRRESPPFGAERPTPSRISEPCTVTLVNITSVLGGAQEPQSGFLDGVAGRRGAKGVVQRR